jgi:hypothetical protein
MLLYRTFDRLGGDIARVRQSRLRRPLRTQAVMTRTATVASIRITLPRVSAATQYRIIFGAMLVALLGGGAVVLHALAAVTAFQS